MDVLGGKIERSGAGVAPLRTQVFRSLGLESPTISFAAREAILKKTIHEPSEPVACDKCGSVYPWSIEYFVIRRYHKDDPPIPRQPCKKCHKAVSDEWFRIHKERKNATAMKWRQDHIETVKAAAKEWVRTHKDTIKIIRKRHQQKPKSKLIHRLESHKRRAMIREAMGNLTCTDIELQYKNQKGKCWWCRAPLEKCHIDHRIPLAKGGKHDRTNIVLACPHCNQIKWTKLPQDFAGRLF